MAEPPSRSVSPAYRLLTYAASPYPRAGVWIGDAVYDAATLTGIHEWSTVLAILADWNLAEAKLEEQARAVTSSAIQPPGISPQDVRLLAPVRYPGNVFCAGANYTDHLAEMAKAAGRDPGPSMRERGESPWHFIKTSSSSVVGHGAAVPMPNGSGAVDWEIELAAVVGKGGKDIAVDDALACVAGYTIANDLSARDFLKRTKAAPSSPFYYDWIGHKCFDGSCPMGPWIVPARSVPDPQNLGLKLWVGDELMQDSSTSEMIFSVAEQIAALSSRVSLQPGDVVLTGTPAGVGAGRNRFLKRGEQVRLWIEGIGELKHTMA